MERGRRVFFPVLAMAIAFAAVVAGGCAERAAPPPGATSLPIAAPSAATPPPADAPPLESPAGRLWAPRGGRRLTVSPIDPDEIETLEFPCPDVPKDDPDYMPCDGGHR